jgi:hypothetical protein
VTPSGRAAVDRVINAVRFYSYTVDPGGWTIRGKAGRSAILAATTGTEGTVVALRLSGTIELIIFGLDNVRYWPKADMACGTAHASSANMQK